MGIPVPGYQMFLKPHFLRLIQLYELHAVNCRCILQLAWMNEAKWETLVQTSIIQENTLRLDFCQWWHPPVTLCAEPQVGHSRQVVSWLCYQRHSGCSPPHCCLSPRALLSTAPIQDSQPLAQPALPQAQFLPASLPQLLTAPVCYVGMFRDS